MNDVILIIYLCMHIVLIDDEKILSNFIKKKLTAHDYSVSLISSFTEFMSLKAFKHVDLFLIDISLGDGSGFDVMEVLKSNKKTKDTPIIFISGHNDLPFKVRGLEDGWDDYIVKPFEFDELHARIRNALRKSINSPISTKITFGDIVFNTTSRSVYLKTKEVSLTRKEKRVLEYFLTNQGVCVKKPLLKEKFWDNLADDAEYENIINVTVCNLRKKLWSSLKLKTVVWEWYCLWNK